MIILNIKVSFPVNLTLNGKELLQGLFAMPIGLLTAQCKCGALQMSNIHTSTQPATQYLTYFLSVLQSQKKDVDEKSPTVVSSGLSRKRDRKSGTGSLLLQCAINIATINQNDFPYKDTSICSPHHKIAGKV